MTEFFAGYIIGALVYWIVFAVVIRIERNEDNKSLADNGLLYCRLGDNYVWLTKAQVQKHILGDEGE